MKKIMTVLAAVTLCAGVVVASYATSAQYQPAPTKVAATAGSQTGNNCEQRKEASLQNCKNERCKQYAANNYSKCNMAFAKNHPQMNAQQPQTQQR